MNDVIDKTYDRSYLHDLKMNDPVIAVSCASMLGRFADSALH